MLLGIEIYKQRPIFYGLGNFIFQSRTPQNEYPQSVWQSAIADCHFSKGEVKSLVLRPVGLTDGEPGENHFQTRGRPYLVEAGDAEGEKILARLAMLSTAWGTQLQYADGIGKVMI